MKIKKILVVTLSLVVFFSLTVSSSAYVLNSYRWSTSAIFYYYATYNSARVNAAYSSAMNSWDDAGADPTMLYSTSPNVYLYETQDSSLSWDGITNITVNSNYYVTDAYIIVNTGARSTAQNDNALLSVAAHEFGHLFCLADNGETRTIMNKYTIGTNSRYETYGLTTPQQDDVNGVNSAF